MTFCTALTIREMLNSFSNDADCKEWLLDGEGIFKGVPACSAILLTRRACCFYFRAYARSSVRDACVGSSAGSGGVAASDTDLCATISWAEQRTCRVVFARASRAIRLVSKLQDQRKGGDANDDESAEQEPQ